MNIVNIKNSMIFRALSEEEIISATKSLKAAEKSYEKGSIIFHAGQTTDMMGLVTRGSVTIENNDIWGNKTILSHVGRNQFFAETFGLLSDEPLLVDVVANENCSVVFLHIGILKKLSHRESWVPKLILNLLEISANKNLMLSGRSFHTSPKSIRGRVMSYLNSLSIKIKSAEFDIPFDRQQMADYLNTERTALSKELGKMKNDGLIDFKKNHFVLLTDG